MSERQDPDDQALELALFPYEGERTRELIASGRKLAHYTNAHVAHSIISNAEIWMRNVQVMNDFSEVQHGLACMAHARDQGLVGQLFEAVDAAHPGLSQDIAALYDGWKTSFLFDTYITCLSEFAAPFLPNGTPNPENTYGRLSMWRAYGGDNGVALIVDPSFLAQGGDLGNVFTSPVIYGDAFAFAEQFARVVGGIRAIPEVLRRCDREALRHSVFNALRFGILSVKHPGFKEEEEWRVIYTPSMGESPYIKQSVKTVRDVPQVVHTLQLVDDEASGIRLAPAGLIDEVLIGPCEYPLTLRQTFFDAMHRAGVADPANRVRQSGIPLRR
jgi:hypothetical protein